MNDLTLTVDGGQGPGADPAGSGLGASMPGDAGDVAQFHAALNEGRAGPPMTPLSLHADTQSLLSKLQSVSSGIDDRRKSIDKALGKAGDAYDPKAMYLVGKQMAEMNLEASLAIKVIGKVEQTIDQLTRLQ